MNYSFPIDTDLVATNPPKDIILFPELFCGYISA